MVGSCSGVLGGTEVATSFSDAAGPSALALLGMVIDSSAMGVCFTTGATLFSADNSAFLSASGLPAAEVAADVALETGFLAEPLFALAGFLVAPAVFLGGVVGTFSFTLLAYDCVGRIILARKPSSTFDSFFGTGWSFAGSFGGGPRLGRCLPAAETDLRIPLPAVPDAVDVRLPGRTVFA